MIDFPIQLERYGQFWDSMEWGRTDCNFPDSTLADSSVCYHIALLVRLEFLNSMYLSVFFQTLCLVYTPVRPGGYESKNCVLGAHRPMTRVVFLSVEAHSIMLQNTVRPFVKHLSSISLDFDISSWEDLVLMRINFHLQQLSDFANSHAIIYTHY